MDMTVRGNWLTLSFFFLFLARLRLFAFCGRVDVSHGVLERHLVRRSAMSFQFSSFSFWVSRKEGILDLVTRFSTLFSNSMHIAATPPRRQPVSQP
jgi:hypothetical protein